MLRPIPLMPAPGPVLALIHAFEGNAGKFEPIRAKDPSGNWEIGWSHKLTGRQDPLWNATLSAQDADDLALKDVTTAAQGVCDTLIAAVLAELTDNQYGALIDFTYNEGVAAFHTSHLAQLVNQGNFHLVPAELKKWVYAKVNGVETVLDGLIRRRNAEIDVWNL